MCENNKCMYGSCTNRAEYLVMSTIGDFAIYKAFCYRHDYTGAPSRVEVDEMKKFQSDINAAKCNKILIEQWHAGTEELIPMKD